MLGEIYWNALPAKVTRIGKKDNEIFIHKWSIIRNIKKYSIEEVLSKYNKEDELVNFDGDLIPMGSQRYENFKEHGVICTCCGLEGQYFYKERRSGKKQC